MVRSITYRSSDALMPIMLYALEMCALDKRCVQSLDFTINRFCIKLFRTSSIVTVRKCQLLFGLCWLRDLINLLLGMVICLVPVYCIGLPCLVKYTVVKFLYLLLLLLLLLSFLLPRMVNKGEYNHSLGCVQLLLIQIYAVHD